MTSEGDYSFRVRALAKKSSGDSAWSDYSENTWISSSRASFNDTKGNKDASVTGPGVVKKKRMEQRPIQIPAPDCLFPPLYMAGRAIQRAGGGRMTTV